MTVVVLSALGIWNDYQIALVVVSKEAVRPARGAAVIYRAADLVSESGVRGVPPLDSSHVFLIPVFTEIHRREDCGGG